MDMHVIRRVPNSTRVKECLLTVLVNFTVTSPPQRDKNSNAKSNLKDRQQHKVLMSERVVCT